MDKEKIERYGRQLITPGIGVEGQKKLIDAKVLVIGAGGLGCPVALYLACSGVGTIGIVDYDSVEIGNLHRQIAHCESGVGVSKAESLCRACEDRNSLVHMIRHETMFTSETAMDIVKDYDLVIDASDNVATRYLVNDCCILSKKPLVSGSALKWDGQVTVYNYQGGPCYRCLFPNPPPAETVTRCADGGVLGPIVGVIGSLQALECIKILSGQTDGILSGRLLIYDGQQSTFKTVRIRQRQPGCQVCGDNPSITQLIDYPQFCQSPYSESVGKADDRIDPHLIITTHQFKQILDSHQPHILLDVRPKIQFDICSLPNSFNIPIDELNKKDNLDKINNLLKENDNLPLYIICRRGNKSQDATTILKKQLDNEKDNHLIKHIKDGLLGWSEDIDPSFPVY